MSHEAITTNAQMQPARVPLDESERLNALRALQILDSSPSEFYDRITRIAAKALDMPIVLVSLVDAHRQWFKSRVGLDVTETPREVSFCAHAVFGRAPVVVPDATQDERFAGNPLVTGAPHIRAYIGVPLLTRNGHAIGTLCAIDTRRARDFDEDDLRQLIDYAKILEESIHAQELARAKEDVLKFATKQVELFHDTFNQAAVGITHVSPAGKLLRVNHRACDMLGYSEAELHEISFAEITHPADLVHDMAAFRQMLAGGLDRYRLEKRFRCKNADYLWTEVWVALKRGNAGEPDYVIAVMVDISSRKHAEAELLTIRDNLRSQVDQQTAELREGNQVLARQIEKSRESERVAREAMNQLEHIHYALDQHASVAVTDLDGVITYANKRFCELSGYTQEELIGQTHRIVKSGLQSPAVFEDLWRTILSGSVWRGELCNRKKTGEHYWMDASIVPYNDETGRIVRFVTIRIDITERKRNQELLAAEEIKSRKINERLRKIADSLPAIISYWDREGICGFANQAHFDRFGLTPQQIVGMSFQSLFGPSFDDRRVYIEAALRGERQVFEHGAVMADGRLRHFRSEYIPHWESAGVIGFYVLALDITQQKQVEADLAQAQKLESIGQLAAGIAHEINTPAQFIGNNVGFLKDSMTEVLVLIARIANIADTSKNAVVDGNELVSALQTVDLSYVVEEVPKAIDQSLEGIERIQKIVGAMKEFSHPAMEKVPVDLNRAINTTIIVASNEWKYVAEVKTDFDEGLPHVSVVPGSFNQVILNMIVNAAHAIGETVETMPTEGRSKGTISVSTRRVGRWAEIRIRDTGGGIPHEIRERIFDPFFTTKPIGKGTGQGLAIAYDVIVKKHVGDIAVESEVGVGTTFIIRIPMVEENTDVIAAA